MFCIFIVSSKCSMNSNPSRITYKEIEGFNSRKDAEIAIENIEKSLRYSDISLKFSIIEK